jgi:hypothetical protein
MWITKRLKTIHTLLFLLVFSSGWAVAATYYVSPTGSDSSSGSATTPFKTIQKAANIVNPGDTVIVRNGTYTDTNSDRIVSLRRRGTPSAWITFKAENKWGAVLDGQNVAGYGWHSKGKGIGYIRIEDFEIKNLRETAIHLSGGTTNITIYGNKIHDVARRQISCTEGGAAYGKDGIYASPLANNITIDSNLIFNIGRLRGCDANDQNKDHGLYMCATYYNHQ